MRPEPRTIWDKLAQCVSILPEPFGAPEILSWFPRHYPDGNQRSLRTHIQGATSNVPVQSRGQFTDRQPLITRIGRGTYVRVSGGTAPHPPPGGLDPEASIGDCAQRRSGSEGNPG